MPVSGRIPQHGHSRSVRVIPARMSSESSEGDSTTLRPLSVTYRSTGSLKPDPRNARTHSKRQVEQIVASIRQFGFTNPILIDPDGVLIAGHGRLLAAKSMGMAEVPTIELVGLNDAQKRALRLADNKIALGAGWDLDLLKVELTELSSLDVDMDLTVTGFSTGELDLLLSGNEDPDDDVIPPLPPIHVRGRATSGPLAIIGSAAATAAISSFCAGWLARAPKSTPPSLTRPTTFVSAATPTRGDATASL